ncbi:hypothetical protein MKW94_029681 [Papaver nudicaule]|uniref:Response regulatory domain-containing protein n=1 Tax=Papaver nudicaule TaxID=74823 RepID=A0AA41RW19_PAPNU|nr:hypothetical protein [Papaver nudicaule]
MSATSSTPSSSSPALVFKVTTVESASKALDKLLRGDMSYQMVITDYEMPGMTGYDLLKTIKETSSLRNIPVVLVSSDKKFSDECLNAGAHNFIEKLVKLLDVETLVKQPSSK